MKYAGKTFTLYASQPVAIQGSDSLYTYQNTGTGTATIVGSNNAVNWTTVATVASGASHTGSHAYAFLMMTGSTEVSVSRGVAGDDVTSQTTLQGTQGTGASYDPPTGGSGVFGWLSGIFKEIVSGIELKLGGSGVSASNPLPTNLPAGWAINTEAANGKLWLVRFTKSLTFGKYAAIQVKNTNSKPIYVAVISVGNSIGTTPYRVIQSVADLTNISSASVLNYDTSISGSSPPFHIRDQALDALSTTPSYTLPSNISAVNPTTSQITTNYIKLAQNKAIQIEQDNISLGFIASIQIIET